MDGFDVRHKEVTNAWTNSSIAQPTASAPLGRAHGRRWGSDSSAGRLRWHRHVHACCRYHQHERRRPECGDGDGYVAKSGCDSAEWDQCSRQGRYYHRDHGGYYSEDEQLSNASCRS